VDINKIGIKPQVVLAPEALPLDAPGVCKALTSASAPPLFGAR
jgi:hypothetical protein